MMAWIQQMLDPKGRYVQSRMPAERRSQWVWTEQPWISQEGTGVELLRVWVVLCVQGLPLQSHVSGGS